MFACFYVQFLDGGLVGIGKIFHHTFLYEMVP